MRCSAKHCAGSLEKDDVKMEVVQLIFERLPVGIVQLPGTFVEVCGTMVNEPGAKIPESGRRRVRAETTTIIGLNKRA
jgi:hypothetical protein